MTTTRYEEELLVTFTYKFQDPESVKGLLAKGVSPNVTLESRTNILMLAALLPNSDICEALIKAGAIVNCSNDDGVTPLHCANTARAAELLIEAGAELDAQDEGGKTPLHFAVLRGVVPVIEVLLRHGANYLMPSGRGISPFNAALLEGGEILKAFTDHISNERAGIQTVELLDRIKRATH